MSTQARAPETDELHVPAVAVPAMHVTEPVATEEVVVKAEYPEAHVKEHETPRAPPTQAVVYWLPGEAGQYAAMARHTHEATEKHTGAGNAVHVMAGTTTHKSRPSSLLYTNIDHLWPRLR